MSALGPSVPVLGPVPAWIDALLAPRELVPLESSGAWPSRRWPRRRTVAWAVGVLLVVLAAALGVPRVAGPSPTPSDPAEGGRFALVEPGEQLPGDAVCASRVRRSSWEPRPGNYLANHRVPDPAPSLALWPGFDEQARPLLERITGRAEGTTDELLQWASCKWGFPDDLVRALVMVESTWEQAYVGDYTQDPRRCAPGWSVPCPTSFGLTQLKWYYMPGSYPWSRASSAFNLDYALARLRACFEGHVTFFAGDYRAGDVWGCVGAHYAGDWKSDAGYAYTGRVREAMDSRSWLELWPDQRPAAEPDASGTPSSAAAGPGKGRSDD